MKRQSVAFLWTLGVLTTLSVGCAQGGSPVAPVAPVSPDPVVVRADMTLWIQTLQQDGHGPIGGARVIVDDQVRGVTAADGRLQVQLQTPVAEVKVQAQADGYEPSVVYRDRPGIGETWTFYLWR